jgi:hypothetical protein
MRDIQYTKKSKNTKKSPKFGDHLQKNIFF